MVSSKAARDNALFGRIRQSSHCQQEEQSRAAAAVGCHHEKGCRAYGAGENLNARAPHASGHTLPHSKYPGAPDGQSWPGCTGRVEPGRSGQGHSGLGSPALRRWAAWARHTRRDGCLRLARRRFARAQGQSVLLANSCTRVGHDLRESGGVALAPHNPRGRFQVQADGRGQTVGVDAYRLSAIPPPATAHGSPGARPPRTAQRVLFTPRSRHAAGGTHMVLRRRLRSAVATRGRHNSSSSRCDRDTPLAAHTWVARRAAPRAHIWVRLQGC
jgi:hypothetical protein